MRAGPVVIEAMPVANPSLQPTTIALNTIGNSGSGGSHNPNKRVQHGGGNYFPIHCEPARDLDSHGGND
jgi:hypothetical protein